MGIISPWSIPLKGKRLKGIDIIRYLVYLTRCMKRDTWKAMTDDQVLRNGGSVLDAHRAPSPPTGLPSPEEFNRVRSYEQKIVKIAPGGPYELECRDNLGRVQRAYPFPEYLTPALDSFADTKLNKFKRFISELFNTPGTIDKIMDGFSEE